VLGIPRVVARPWETDGSIGPEISMPAFLAQRALVLSKFSVLNCLFRLYCWISVKFFYFLIGYDEALATLTLPHVFVDISR